MNRTDAPTLPSGATWRDYFDMAQVTAIFEMG